MRTYSHRVLNVQHSTLLCIISEKVFEDHSNTLDSYVVYYDGLFLGEGVPDHADVSPGSSGKTLPVYITGLMIG